MFYKVLSQWDFGLVLLIQWKITNVYDTDYIKASVVQMQYAEMKNSIPMFLSVRL